jgi:hypothetical protein
MGINSIYGTGYGSELIGVHRYIREEKVLSPRVYIERHFFPHAYLTDPDLVQPSLGHQPRLSLRLPARSISHPPRKKQLRFYMKIFMLQKFQKKISLLHIYIYCMYMVHR